MRAAFAFLTLLAFLALLTACSKQSMPGGPGASQGPAEPATSSTEPAAPEANRPMAERTTTVTDEANTFTLKVPATTTHIKRGQSDQIDLKISRGSKFDQSVALKIEAPTGLSVDPSTPTIDAGQDSVRVTLKAADDAPLGDQQLRVTATPQTGKAVEETVAIKIDEKS